MITMTNGVNVMNEKLEKFARDTLLEGLNKLKAEHMLLFKRMYSHKDIEKPIDEVVRDMDTDKLDWAMTQVQETLERSYV